MTTARKRTRSLTVRQAIKLLQAMPDKTLAILVDCPYCGRGSQIATVIECVVLTAKAMGEETT